MGPPWYGQLLQPMDASGLPRTAFPNGADAEASARPLEYDSIRTARPRDWSWPGSPRPTRSGPASSKRMTTALKNVGRCE